jgi:hypothetical protein
MGPGCAKTQVRGDSIGTECYATQLATGCPAIRFSSLAPWNRILHLKACVNSGAVIVTRHFEASQQFDIAPVTRYRRIFYASPYRSLRITPIPSESAGELASRRRCNDRDRTASRPGREKTSFFTFFRVR